MAQAQVPAKIDSIRQLFDSPAVKNQLMAAIPKHLSVDRLLRVAMTAIRVNPKLAECSQKSLLACIMGCATLGLEPEPFLGQAYLIPYNGECTLVPGYRGYISLARRSGEVQSVTAQVVYSNDRFHLQYGLNETLDHVPAEGDRGEFKGAYVIFRYKDGSHSFDYMTKADIDKIRKRSMASNKGPWVTDYDEMAKKTVIRRHIKLAPLSVEMATAAALEERANIGESQIDILTGEVTEEGEIIEQEKGSVELFNKLASEKANNNATIIASLNSYIDAASKHFKRPADEIKAEASVQFDEFYEKFLVWSAKKSQNGNVKKEEEPKKEEPDTARISCPDGTEADTGYCNGTCEKRQGCPSWDK